MQNIFLQPSNSRNSFVGHPYNRFRQSRQLEESKVSRESRSNVSTTSSDYDPKSCSWEIAIGESIYDDALIRPLVVYHHLHSGRPIDMRFMYEYRGCLCYAFIQFRFAVLGLMEN